MRLRTSAIKAEAMQTYARQAKDVELIGYATDIRMRAEIRAGELLAMAESGERETGGKPSQAARVTKVKLKDIGVSESQSSRWQQLAALPQDAREERIERAKHKAVSAIDGTKPPRGTAGTGENEWYTPQRYIDAARDVLGEIDLDPATSAFAQSRIRAAAFFTQEDDGLTQDWNGRIWLNPPYAQPLIAPPRTIGRWDEPCSSDQ
jgi:DNA N-6-adenine-methyltransferase (Dam)